MSGFVKLDCGILDSSIMLEDPDTFKAFIIFLASCNSEGIADVPASSIVMRCKVSPARAMEILKILSSPDVLSKSKEEEGRRIIPHGDSGHHWNVVNYKKYRDFNYSNTPEAIRKRRQRGNGEFTITKEAGVSIKSESFLGNGHVTESVTLPGHVTTPLSSVLLSSSSLNSSGINEESINKKEECSGSESSEPPKRKYRYESIHMVHAETLKLKIIESGTDMLLKDSVLPEWANTFRLMQEQDKRTSVQILEKIKKVFEDPFWSKQIRSAGKLRLRWNEGKLDNVGAKKKNSNSYAQEGQEQADVSARAQEDAFTEAKALSALCCAVERYKNNKGENGKKWREFFSWARPDTPNFLISVWRMKEKGIAFTDEVFEILHNEIKEFSGLTYDTFEADIKQVNSRYKPTSAQ